MTKKYQSNGDVVVVVVVYVTVCAQVPTYTARAWHRSVVTLKHPSV